jgi:hypothetical protein
MYLVNNIDQIHELNKLIFVYNSNRRERVRVFLVVYNIFLFCIILLCLLYFGVSTYSFNRTTVLMPHTIYNYKSNTHNLCFSCCDFSFLQ